MNVAYLECLDTALAPAVPDFDVSVKRAGDAVVAKGVEIEAQTVGAVAYA